MRMNTLERLQFKGVIQAIGMGGGLGNDRGGGGAHGGGHGVGDGGGGRNGGGGGNKSNNGRGGQKDVNGKNSPTGDSADNGTHHGRQSDSDRRRTNPMAASRQADAIGELSTQDLDSRRTDRFNHARQAMTVDDKHDAASLATGHVNRNTDKMFDAAGVIGGALGVGVAPLASSAAKSAYNARTHSDMMDQLGSPQTAGDTVAEAARNFVPGLIGSFMAPAGAMLGGTITGKPVGAMVGAKLAKSGTKAGLESQMTRENMNGAPSDTSMVAGGNGNGQQSLGLDQVASVAQSQGSAVENARSAFGYAEIDTDKYSKGLLNAKV